MKIFYCDVETTGLDPKVHEVVQLSYLIEIEGKLQGEGNLWIRPRRLDMVSPDALRIAGKTIEDLKGYPLGVHAYKELTKVLGRYIDKFNRADKFVWAGQNARFDMDFVRAFFVDQGDQYFGSWFESQPTDLISVARFCSMGGLLTFPNYKLQTICETLGVDLKPHDALDDVRATRKCLKALLGFLLKEPVERR